MEKQRTENGARAFESAQHAFARAARTHPEIVSDWTLTLAGQPVRLTVVGRDLGRHVGRPFAHLRLEGSTPSPPQLTIELWDVHESGIPAPESDHAGETTWIVGEGIFSSSDGGRFVGHRLGPSRAWIDRAEQRIVGWVESSAPLSLHQRGKPLQLLLSVWHSDRGVHLIHAGLVSRSGRGVLLPGKGGTGKSTSAIACLCAGFDYLGDDWIGLDCEAERSFIGHSLYSSTWLEPDHAARFPQIAPHAIPGTSPEEIKSLVLLSDLFPGQLRRAVPIRALALPRIVGKAAAEIRRASRVEALLALAPSSLFEIRPLPGIRALDRLTQLVQHVPAFWLDLDVEIGQIPHRVERILAEIGS